MQYTTMLIDLDDTLYSPDSGVWGMVSARIELYIHERLGLPVEEIPALRRSLFQQYGTTLRGLQVTYQVDMDDYLGFVDDVPMEAMLKPDPGLREILLRYPQRKYIFTNADRGYAERVIRLLQLESCFEGIIDIYAIAPFCKPMVEAFQVALGLAGSPPPSDCIFIDDSPRNLVTAGALGMFAVQVGQPKTGSPYPEAGANARIDRLAELPTVLTPLFTPQQGI